jgi:branched-chain amino acid transport system ATP-binding protein
MRKIILDIRGLSKKFGGVTALNKVSLSIEQSSITLLIGPNGSGKTTLINAISGVIRPDSGTIYYEGRNVTFLPPNEKFRIGIVRTFQTPQLFKSLSVLENMLIPSRYFLEERVLDIILTRKWVTRDREQIQKAFEVLSLLRMDHLWDAPASSLSGGQMKLLELARMLMSNPRVALLDEPLAGINPVLAREIMKQLAKVRDELNVTFLMVEHRLDLASSYADFVYAMHQGNVISSGTPDIVLKDTSVLEAYLGSSE